MQTAIYTIAKNEAHNVAAFMKAAEGVPVYVLDTGSTDDTVELLKQHGANVEQQIITPWRFDTARNIALEMVPTSVDSCVSLDMDEVIEPGWQEKLESQWAGNFGNYLYIGAWLDKDKTKPKVVGPRSRLHNRKGFEWTRKIHEVISPLPNTKMMMFSTDIMVKHYQDDKIRNYNLAIDELIASNPLDSNSLIQRAAEYLSKKEYEKSIIDYRAAIRVLDIDEDAFKKYQKCLCWLALAECYAGVGNNEMIFRCFLYAVAEDPNSREGWANLAYTAKQLNLPHLAYGTAMTADKIKSRPPFAACIPDFWGDMPKDLANEMFELIREDK